MSGPYLFVPAFLICSGILLMVIRDYRNMKRATRKDKNSVEEFIQQLDNHDPTCYGQFIPTNKGDRSEQNRAKVS